MARKTVKAGGGLARVGSKATKPLMRYLTKGMPAKKKAAGKRVKSK